MNAASKWGQRLLADYAERERWKVTEGELILQTFIVIYKLWDFVNILSTAHSRNSLIVSICQFVNMSKGVHTIDIDIDIDNSVSRIEQRRE